MLSRSPHLRVYAGYFANAELFVSFQTVAEMRYGALNAAWGERRRAELESFLLSLNVVPIRTC